MNTPTRGNGKIRGLNSVSFAQIRDFVLLVAGLVVVGNETFVVSDPRPLIVGLGAAMIGIPGAIRAEARFLDRPPKREDEPARSSDELSKP